jgi:hypothetical protein
VDTNIGFFAAAAAIPSGILAPLASRLLTAEIVSFEFLVWIPKLVAGPHDHGNGSKARRKASLYRASQAPASRTARRMVLSYQDGPPFGYESLEIKQSPCARRENRPYWRGTQQLRKLRASGSRYSLTNG